MTKEMPKGGKLSLNMMYQTSGTQINLDYLSEDDFKKKFKIISYLTPISIAIFANSTILENKPSGYLSYRSKVWQNTSRGGLPKIFLENMDFEKYADFAINFPLLFIYKNNDHKNLNNKTFGDFMKGSLSEVNNHLPNFKDLELIDYSELKPTTCTGADGDEKMTSDKGHNIPQSKCFTKYLEDKNYLISFLKNIL